MPAYQLSSAIQRVRRANEHLVDLRKLLADFRMGQENLAIAKFQDEERKNINGTVTNINVNIIASADIAIRIGEICYNLRTSLEYFIFELAKLDSGIYQDGTQFPIEDTRQRWPGESGQWAEWIFCLRAARIAADQERA